MKVIRDLADPIGMSVLLIDWGLRRCNQKGCTAKPNTIISPQGSNGAISVFGLCEGHYQQGNVPGGTKFELIFDNFDAFKFDEIEREIMNATPEEIDQYLRDAGYDPDAIGERMQQIAQKASDESPMNPKNKGLQS